MNEIALGYTLGVTIRILLCIAATKRGKWGILPWLSFPTEIIIGVCLGLMYNKDLINNNQMDIIMFVFGIAILLILITMVIVRRKPKMRPLGV